MLPSSAILAQHGGEELVRSLSGACSSLKLSCAPHHLNLNYEVQYLEYPSDGPAISGRIHPCRGIWYLIVPVNKVCAVLQQHLRCVEINVILLLVALAFEGCSRKTRGVCVEWRACSASQSTPIHEPANGRPHEPRALAVNGLPSYIDFHQPRSL